MAKRSGQNIDLIWAHLDATSGDFAQAVADARALHEARGDFKLSVNMKADGSQALVKVAGATLAWAASRTWKLAVFRVFTEADHDQAVALVTDPAWTGGM